MTFRLSALTVCILTLACGVYAQGTLDIEKEWRFNPDPEAIGASKQWYAPDFDDSGWAVIDAGKRWEDQGYAELDGHAWYRKSVEIPADWKGKKVWLTFGGVNDSCVLYCNGQKVAEYGDRAQSVSKSASTTEMTAHLRYGESNLIAIDIDDWALSGGLWRPPCLLTTDAAQLPVAVQVQSRVGHEDAEYTIEVVLTGLGKNRPKGTFQFDLYREGDSKRLKQRTEPIPDKGPAIWTTFNLPREISDVTYQVKIQGIDPQGGLIPGTITDTDGFWNGAFAPPASYKSVKVLNNFAAELLKTKCPRDGEKKYSFHNPKEGWVFVSLDAGKQKEVIDSPSVLLDDESKALLLRPYPENGNLEAMRYLEPGSHSLTVKNGQGRQLIVRSVPELIYCRHPLDPAIKEYGSYDWEYLTKHVLSNVNAITTYGDAVPEEQLDQWANEGRKWIDQAHLAGLGQPKPPTAEEVYAEWKDKSGTLDSRYSGLIVDEFINAGTIDYYRPWAAGLDMLSEDPNFAGKKLYAWCGLMARYEATAGFREVVMDNDYRFVWEQYFYEQVNDQKARCYLLRRLVADTQFWLESAPDVAPQIIQCFALFCAPPGTVNLNPAIDYKVHMDMQMRYMATEPAMWGQCGILPWYTGYADEEILRWVYRLFRHYCIEGKRTPFTDDPYVLPHIDNPDFDDDLASWTVDKAEGGDVNVLHIEGFGSLQGRYPKTPHGDHLLSMKRSPKGPNRVSQIVKQLDPSRLYSLKLISLDMNNPGREGKLPLNVSLDGVQMIPEKCFIADLKLGGQCQDESGRTIQSPKCDYYRLVFRPKGRTAELSISDWKSPSDSSGGLENQEIGLNFLELQPYYEGD